MKDGSLIRIKQPRAGQRSTECFSPRVPFDRPLSLPVSPLMRLTRLPLPPRSLASRGGEGCVRGRTMGGVVGMGWEGRVGTRVVVALAARGGVTGGEGCRAQAPTPLPPP